MSTGNYDHDNFVRVDCAASSEQFRINAIHETAHFSLIKQSFFGLLCFFLRQDTRDARSPLEPAQRTLEQAFECTNECYARAKELFLCTPFPSADLRQREAILAAQRAQPYFGRYHMERLTPILLQYDLAVRCSLFPDRLFLMAAEVDVTPLLDCGFADLRRLQSLILCQQERLYPDHRLSLLLQAFSSLLQRYPPERITERLLAREAGISCAPLSTRPAARFFRRLAAAVPARPTLQSLLAANLQRLRDNPYPAPTAESLKTAFRFSLSDCVVPAALEPRFSYRQTSAPVFRPERNILCIFLEPEVLLPPDQLMNQSICPGPRSALLRFTDTRAGLIFCDAYIADLMEARLLLDLYPGGVYLYLDDYAQYHRLGPFRSSPVFFRSDVPWNELKTELTVQGFHMERIFLQRYSDSVFFFFGFDPLGNVVFSMLAHWEIDKIYTALAGKAFTLCGRSDAERYGPFPWYVYRDLIAAVTEDRTYGCMDYSTFHGLRFL